MGIAQKWGLTYSDGRVSRVGVTIVIILFVIMIGAVMWSVYQSGSKSDQIMDLQAANSLKQAALRYVVEDSSGEAYGQLHSLDGLTLTIAQLIREKHINDIPVDSAGHPFLALNVRAESDRYIWILSYTKDTDLKPSDSNFGPRLIK